MILYGSYAKGTYREDSDIDIAIVTDTVEGDLLDNKALLFRLRRSIDDRIEPILIEEDNDKSGFPAEIMKYGEVILISIKNPTPGIFSFILAKIIPTYLFSIGR